jgi:hypothetical protein
MEENAQEDSEMSVNTTSIQETPQTPTQNTLEVGYNDNIHDIHTPTFQPRAFHPIPFIVPITPTSYHIPHPDYTQLSSSWTSIPIPVHPAATPRSEHQPLNGPRNQAGGKHGRRKVEAYSK